ncbi:MAG: hypothetical protein ACPKOI_01650 [Pleomorphochaeta sp.]|jgi:hypothetical protein
MQSWESHCKKCGLCCHEKVVIDDTLVVDLDSYCENFDIKTKTCKIYAKRFIDSVRCKKVTLAKAMFAPYLPPTCGYVEWARLKGIRFSSIRMLRLIHSKQPTSDDDANDSLYQYFN